MGRPSQESIDARRERNRQVVAEELERRGGHCVFEGCMRTNIEWHHRDPETKNDKIGNLVRASSVEKLLVELALCDPLCRRHHIIVDGRLESLIATRYTHVKTKARADAKLTEDDVREIRREHGLGTKITRMALWYGVNHSLISDIVHGKRWAWVAD